MQMKENLAEGTEPGLQTAHGTFAAAGHVEQRPLRCASRALPGYQRLLAQVVELLPYTFALSALRHPDSEF